MQTKLQEFWDKALELLKTELSGISFETWIKTLEPLAMDETSITLRVSSVYQKGILQTKYLDLIKNTIKHITHKEYTLVFVTPEEVGQGTGDSTEPNAAASNHSNSYLNPKYTFDSFVIGNSNRFAHAASLAVAEAPAKAYNPLFIYGGVGLGKTHLMHAIGRFILDQTPSQKVLYVTSEKFTNELINAIKDDKNKEFRDKYRNMDVLLIDDIQFIAGKERTQEEFFHTFNALYEAGKQIILSSDKPPKDIVPLEDRLRSRFEWGLIADIQPPDYETRIAILRKKAQQDKLVVSDEITSFIANKVESNIRELEGTLNKIIAYASLTNSEMTLKLAEKAIKDITSSRKKTITSTYIQEMVAKYFDINKEDLRAQKRTRDITLPRQIAMYLCREYANLSLPKIGEAFGGRDHTTVIHSYNKISEGIKTKPEVRNAVEDIRRNIFGN